MDLHGVAKSWTRLNDFHFHPSTQRIYATFLGFPHPPPFKGDPHIIPSQHFCMSITAQMTALKPLICLRFITFSTRLGSLRAGAESALLTPLSALSKT